ncbi:Pimeloyl-ACP methyl ester carboxylesterase [Roseovarius lutimaris]|uniref:Pimeloyl-ACP methyl ester carboxylesterase n=1 Tax=Roseovarius lutimaris TaxID=1005928 RepID=A0A1I5CX27_9RHOB|nr:alpha/beta hydrolase [Roseovarius lutimaris]SFN91514.1 Pimeloyl-ACP methyl ester carboxylesterase [Roseovarius lutimaris]
MKQALYFCHGLPGSPSDADLGFADQFDLPPIIAPDLFSAKAPGDDPVKTAIAQFESLTGKIPDGSIHLLGFSMGAMLAIHIAAAHPERIKRLTLISPAAPLQLGNFLPHMAGQPLFRLAARHPSLFLALTYGQGLLARAAPELLIRRLFASAGGSEHALLEHPDAAEAIRQGLRHSYTHHPKGYARMIAAYVSDWSPVLTSILCPMDIWQGTADRWVPLAMTQALADRLPGKVRLRLLEGAGHYSTLSHLNLGEDPAPSDRMRGFGALRVAL